MNVFISSFLLISLLSLQANAQTQKPKSNPITKTTVVSEEQPKAEEKPASSFYDRLGVNYFGVLTTPHFKKFNTRNAAISPEYSGPCQNCDTYAMNLWNQVNFSYNFGAKMKFEIIPRFTVMLAHPSDQDPGDRAAVTLEDTVVGFSGVIYSSEDKKFNWWMRPAMRLPTSRFSRQYEHPDFGNIAYQPELLQSFSYAATPKLEIGITHIHRVWVFEDRYNLSRHRILNIPYFTYAIDDKTKFQAYYEHFWETNKRHKSVNELEPLYYDVWQNLMVGVSRDVTSKVNVMPFISAFVNDVPFSTRSFWAGLWVSAKFK